MPKVTTTEACVIPCMIGSPGVGDTIGIGPELAIPGYLESVSESNRAHPWNWYRNQYRLWEISGISISIGIDNH